MSKRINTNYPGVYYREGQRLGKQGIERIYYIVFKKDGKVYEEKVGRQFVHGMTAARAALIRGERIEGKRPSRKEIRIAEEAKRQAEKNRWITKKFSPLHGLRHVYASMLASSGQVDMYTLQKLLTHKDPNMTQRYAHLRDEALIHASDLAVKLIEHHATQNLNRDKNVA